MLPVAGVGEGGEGGVVGEGFLGEGAACPVSPAVVGCVDREGDAAGAVGELAVDVGVEVGAAFVVVVVEFLAADGAVEVGVGGEREDSLGGVGGDVGEDVAGGGDGGEADGDVFDVGDGDAVGEDGVGGGAAGGLGVAGDGGGVFGADGGESPVEGFEVGCDDRCHRGSLCWLAGGGWVSGVSRRRRNRWRW